MLLYLYVHKDEENKKITNKKISSSLIGEFTSKIAVNLKDSTNRRWDYNFLPTHGDAHIAY